MPSLPPYEPLALSHIEHRIALDGVATPDRRFAGDGRDVSGDGSGQNERNAVSRASSPAGLGHVPRSASLSAGVQHTAHRRSGTPNAAAAQSPRDAAGADGVTHFATVDSATARVRSSAAALAVRRALVVAVSAAFARRVRVTALHLAHAVPRELELPLALTLPASSVQHGAPPGGSLGAQFVASSPPPSGLDSVDVTSYKATIVASSAPPHSGPSRFVEDDVVGIDTRAATGERAMSTSLTPAGQGSAARSPLKHVGVLPSAARPPVAAPLPLDSPVTLLSVVPDAPSSLSTTKIDDDAQDALMDDTESAAALPKPLTGLRHLLRLAALSPAHDASQTGAMGAVPPVSATSTTSGDRVSRTEHDVPASCGSAFASPNRPSGGHSAVSPAPRPTRHTFVAAHPAPGSLSPRPMDAAASAARLRAQLASMSHPPRDRDGSLGDVVFMDALVAPVTGGAAAAAAALATWGAHDGASVVVTPDTRDRETVVMSSRPSVTVANGAVDVAASGSAVGSSSSSSNSSGSGSGSSNDDGGDSGSYSSSSSGFGMTRGHDAVAAAARFTRTAVGAVSSSADAAITGARLIASRAPPTVRRRLHAPPLSLQLHSDHVPGSYSALSVHPTPHPIIRLEDEDDVESVESMRVLVSSQHHSARAEEANVIPPPSIPVGSCSATQGMPYAGTPRPVDVRAPELSAINASQSPASNVPILGSLRELAAFVCAVVREFPRNAYALGIATSDIAARRAAAESAKAELRVSMMQSPYCDYCRAPKAHGSGSPRDNAGHVLDAAPASGLHLNETARVGVTARVPDALPVGGASSAGASLARVSPGIEVRVESASESTLRVGAATQCLAGRGTLNTLLRTDADCSSLSLVELHEHYPGEDSTEKSCHLQVPGSGLVDEGDGPPVTLGVAVSGPSHPSLRIADVLSNVHLPHGEPFGVRGALLVDDADARIPASFEAVATPPMLGHASAEANDGMTPVTGAIHLLTGHRIADASSYHHRALWPGSESTHTPGAIGTWMKSSPGSTPAPIGASPAPIFLEPSPTRQAPLKPALLCVTAGAPTGSAAVGSSSSCVATGGHAPLGDVQATDATATSATQLCPRSFEGLRVAVPTHSALHALRVDASDTPIQSPIATRATPALGSTLMINVPGENAPHSLDAAMQMPSQRTSSGGFTPHVERKDRTAHIHSSSASPGRRSGVTDSARILRTFDAAGARSSSPSLILQALPIPVASRATNISTTHPAAAVSLESDASLQNSTRECETNSATHFVETEQVVPRASLVWSSMPSVSGHVGGENLISRAHDGALGEARNATATGLCAPVPENSQIDQLPPSPTVAPIIAATESGPHIRLKQRLCTCATGGIYSGTHINSDGRIGHPAAHNSGYGAFESLSQHTTPIVTPGSWSPASSVVALAPVGPVRLVAALTRAIIRLSPATCGAIEYDALVRSAAGACAADEGVARFIGGRLLDAWPRADAEREKALLSLLCAAFVGWGADSGNTVRQGGSCMDVWEGDDAATHSDDVGVVRFSRLHIEPASSLTRRVVTRMCLAVRSQHMSVANDAILACLPRPPVPSRGRTAPSPFGEWLVGDGAALLMLVRALESIVGVVRAPLLRRKYSPRHGPASAHLVLPAITSRTRPAVLSAITEPVDANVDSHGGSAVKADDSESESSETDSDYESDSSSEYDASGSEDDSGVVPLVKVAHGEQRRVARDAALWNVWVAAVPTPMSWETRGTRDKLTIISATAQRGPATSFSPDTYLPSAEQASTDSSTSAPCTRQLPYELNARHASQLLQAGGLARTTTLDATTSSRDVYKLRKPLQSHPLKTADGEVVVDVLGTSDFGTGRVNAARELSGADRMADPLMYAAAEPAALVLSPTRRRHAAASGTAADPIAAATSPPLLRRALSAPQHDFFADRESQKLTTGAQGCGVDVHDSKAASGAGFGFDGSSVVMSAGVARVSPTTSVVRAARDAGRAQRSAARRARRLLVLASLALSDTVLCINATQSETTHGDATFYGVKLDRDSSVTTSQHLPAKGGHWSSTIRSNASVLIASLERAVRERLLSLANDGFADGTADTTTDGVTQLARLTQRLRRKVARLAGASPAQHTTSQSVRLATPVTDLFSDSGIGEAFGASPRHDDDVARLFVSQDDVPPKDVGEKAPHSTRRRPGKLGRYPLLRSQSDHAAHAVAQMPEEGPGMPVHGATATPVSFALPSVPDAASLHEPAVPARRLLPDLHAAIAEGRMRDSWQSVGANTTVPSPNRFAQQQPQQQPCQQLVGSTPALAAVREYLTTAGRLTPPLPFRQ